MHSWDKLLDGEPGLTLAHHLRDERMIEMNEEQQPYLGQRCAVISPVWKGFGTIVKIEQKRSAGGDMLTYLRVEFDGGGSSWYEEADVELLPTYPAV